MIETRVAILELLQAKRDRIVQVLAVSTLGLLANAAFHFFKNLM
jgi:hypothetical protein